LKPFILLPGEGETMPGPNGGPLTLKARAETTNGTFTALEVTIGAKQGPPLHRHIREDEMFYMLDGSFLITDDERIFDAPTGSLVFVPRGTPHCFQNVGERTGEDPRDVHARSHGAVL
jgi:mannose-6-phosphate isomerase-like protein (cupin superfamily)